MKRKSLEKVETKSDRFLLEETSAGVKLLLERTANIALPTQREGETTVVTALQNMIDKLESENADLRTAQSRFRSVEDDLIEARTTLRISQNYVATLKTEMQGRKAAVQSTLQSLKDELAEARRRVESSPNDVAKLEAENQDLKKAQSLSQASEKELVEARVVLGTQRSYLAKIENEKQQLEAAQLILQQSNTDLDQRYTSASAEVTNVQDALKKVTQVKEDLSSQLSEMNLRYTELESVFGALSRFSIHVFGQDDLYKFMCHDSIQNAGQVGEMATAFIIKQLYPTAVVENVGRQQDTCDLLCTFDPELDSKKLLIECKNGTLTGNQSCLTKSAIDKFVDNFINNTKYDGGVLIVSTKHNIPTWYKDCNDQKVCWFEGHKFKKHNNLFICKRESSEMKLVIDSALLDIRATANMKRGAAESQKVLQEHRDFVTRFANSMNPRLRSLCGLTKEFHQDFALLTTFATNHQIDIAPFPPLKSVLT